jgi:hypothetical protein
MGGMMMGKSREQKWKAMEKRSWGLGKSMRFRRACDMARAPRKVLAHHDPSSRPEHIHHDLNFYLSEEAHARLDANDMLFGIVHGDDDGADDCRASRHLNPEDLQEYISGMREVLEQEGAFPEHILVPCAVCGASDPFNRTPCDVACTWSTASTEAGSDVGSDSGSDSHHGAYDEGADRARPAGWRWAAAGTNPPGTPAPGDTEGHRLAVAEATACLVSAHARARGHKRGGRPRRRRHRGKPGLTLHVAGTTCTDWSRRGQRAGLAGKSTRPFYIWVHERLRRREHIIIQECTEDFPESLLHEALGQYYEIYTILLGPDDLGWPVRRPRKYRTRPCCSPSSYCCRGSYLSDEGMMRV